MESTLQVTSKKVFTVVDDALEMRVLLTGMIRKLFPGSEVHAAANVSELLDSMNVAPPSILISDLYIREGSGFDILQALPRDRRDFPILVISFDHRPDTVQRLFEEGADDYMNKPLDSALFKAKVENLLLRTSGSSQKTLPRASSLVEPSPAALKFSGQLLCAGALGLHLESPVSLAEEAEIDLEIGGVPCRAKVISSKPGAAGKFLLVCQWVTGIGGGDRELHAMIESLRPIR